jgi:hypothetical protein
MGRKRKFAGVSKRADLCLCLYYPTIISTVLFIHQIHTGVSKYSHYVIDKPPQSADEIRSDFYFNEEDTTTTIAWTIMC